MKKLGRFFLNLLSDFMGLLFNIGIFAIVITAFWAIVSAIGWIGVKCSATIALSQPTSPSHCGKMFAVGTLLVFVAILIDYIVRGVINIVKYFINVWKRSNDK